MTTFLVDFVQAITKELKYFIAKYNGTVILNTELKSDDFTANFPLCIIEIDGAPESARLPGNGITRLDWNFSLHVYAFEPNAYNSEDGGSSAGLLQIIDDLRAFMENEVWQVQEMNDLLTNYGFRLTFSGIDKAPDMSTSEGICMGYKLNFISIAFDQNTNATIDFTDTNQTVSGTVDFEI